MGVEVHGDEALQRWRELRPFFHIVMVGCVAYVTAAWLWWDATMDEVVAAGSGLALIAWGSLLWRHGIIAFGYSSETAHGETTRTFSDVESPVSPRIVVPVFLVLGAVLLVPSSPIPGADRFRPWTSAMLTARDAGQNVMGIPGLILGWVLLPVVVVVFVVFGVGMVVAPFVQLFMSMVGHREDSDGGDWVLVPLGFVLLGFTALVIYVVVTQFSQSWGDYFRPFEEIAGWFS